MLGCRQRSSWSRVPAATVARMFSEFCWLPNTGNEEGSCDPLDRVPRGATERAVMIGPRVRGSANYGRCGGRVGPRGRLRGTVPCV